jgi:NaMN:DMB phosphoribosyltransferase
MQTTNDTIEIVSSEASQAARCQKIISEIKKTVTVDFTLALGATAISDIDGISAAGASASARRLTPKLDAEALLTGRTAGGEALPSSPVGVTSPVVITRACLSLIKNRTNIVDCGTFAPPDAEHVSLGFLPGKNIAQTNSMDLEQVRKLYQLGQEMAGARFCTGKPKGAGGGKTGQNSSAQNGADGLLPVLSECVPGGTTTALAVLKALGIEADNLLSSSVPGQRMVKAQIVAEALQRLEGELGAGKLQALCREEPLLAVAYLGDPMQAFAAGFALGALGAVAGLDTESEGCLRVTAGPQAVVLAGGSQMLALYALVRALAKSGHADFLDSKNLSAVELIDQTLIVATTKWVAHDPFGNTQALAAMIGAPYAAARIDFSRSRHAGLRAYEEGHVKEGVGAGAALMLASLLGKRENTQTSTKDHNIDESTILRTIEDFYDMMILAEK